ncbi:integrase, partial [Candidatus Magnetomorum sp. HK-1]
MTPLRKKMTDEMKFRRFSENTIESYLFAVTGLAKFYNRTPDKITHDEAQSYLLHLQEERGLSWSTCNVVASGIIFFYNKVLDSPPNIKLKLPHRKQKKSLPEVLSKDEIETLFNSTTTMRDRLLLMTTYAAGLRVGELVVLRPKDIDSKRMMIRVVDGKGNKDRYTVLSTKLLSNLRTYYQNYRPDNYIFPSKVTGKHITTSVVQKVYKKAQNKAQISKGHGIHILRHNFATNLYEAGIDIRIIQ